MKIGILTFHYAYNYGGILQCFALLNYFRNNGVDIWIVDRKPNKTKFSIQNFLTTKVGGYNFDRFRNSHIQPTTKRISSSEELRELINTSAFDGIVVGSDQIWRLDYTNVGLDYFLDSFPNNIRKIAYAASFGKDFCTENAEIRKKISNLLKSFDVVSVREDEGVRICQREFDVTATHVLDPTFLIERSLYPIKCRNQNKIDRYLLTYILDKSEIANMVIAEVSAEKRLRKIVNIIPHNKNKYIRRLLKFFMLSIENWLTNFNNSTFIITDSFHGVCFSIIFKKQFVVINNKQRGSSRITSLLKIFNLENRLVRDRSELQKIISQDIDYEAIEPIKNEWILKSQNILNLHINHHV